MIQIRSNCFETNSSSTHSLIICDNKTWEKFIKRKLYYNVLSHEARPEHEDASDWSKHCPFGYSLPKFLTDEDFKKALPKLQKECAGYLEELVFKFNNIIDSQDTDSGHYVEYFLG